MRIGELATQTGASVRSLRYYEEQGLLSPQRTSSDQRIYGPDAVERVRLLRRLYNSGLNSATIASVLPCVDVPSVAVTVETLGILRREHARIDDQIIELVRTRDDLTYLIDHATAFHDEQLATDSHSAA
jgi:DNA-binding transcriptional MerR regulator